MSARSHCALCHEDCTHEEHALTREQGAALGLDADTVAVCLRCLRGVYAARDRREAAAQGVEVRP